MFLRLLVSGVAVIITARVARMIYRMVHWRLFSPFRCMPGPPNESWIYGNRGRLIFSTTQEWQKVYGPTFKTHIMFGITQLYTIDPTALHHIVNNDRIYQKSSLARFGLGQLLGKGLLVMEDEEHTKFRKIMSPAFGPSQIRGLTQLFLDKSIQLSQVWAGQDVDSDGWAHLNAIEGLKKMTLDVIGLAGFNYEFHALDPEKTTTPLGQLFTNILRGGNAQRLGPISFLRATSPLLRAIIPGSKRVTTIRKRMEDIGMQLLREAKAGEKDLERKDLLSLLVSSNMSESVLEHQRLSDAEVVAQIPTFFVAGHETTSTATSWALYALAAHPLTQTTLRTELLAMGTDTPTLDALNALPYLDKFVREVLRVHTPVVFTNRTAICDDVIPLQTPYTDTRGVQHDRIPVTKGQMIFIPVAALNRDPRIWGEDAADFNPERWDNIPDATTAIPGVYSHLFTFLGGSHNCIGWRFSLAEMKSLLYTLVRAFEFELAVPASEIVASRTAVQRPMLATKLEGGPQLPMRVRRVQV